MIEGMAGGTEPEALGAAGRADRRVVVGIDLGDNSGNAIRIERQRMEVTAPGGAVPPDGAHCRAAMPVPGGDLAEMWSLLNVPAPIGRWCWRGWSRR